MELIAVLRSLWHRRLLVGIGAIVAVACAILAGGTSRVVGLGSTRVVVNTPRTPLVDTSLSGGRLPNHAPLLADLLATDRARASLASAAAVPANQLAVVDSRLIAPVVGTPLPLAASQASGLPNARYTLVLRPYSSLVPIVQLDAVTPDAASAARLLAAATSVLKAIAARGASSSSPGLVVGTIMAPRVHQVSHGPHKLREVAIAMLVFGLWCTAVLLVPRTRRRRLLPAWRRRLIRVGACGLVATVAAVISVSTVSLLPPALHARDLTVAGSALHVLVDAPPPSAPDRAPYSLILDPLTLPQDFDAAARRTGLLASLLTSRTVVADVALRAGVSPDAIASFESPIPNIPVALAEAPSEKRSSELVQTRRPYRLEIQPRPLDPIIDIYTQAPSPAAAQRLALAALAGLKDYLRSLAAANGAQQAPAAQLVALGVTGGAQLTSGTKTIAGLTFVAVFLLWLCVLKLLSRWRQHRALAPGAAASTALRSAPGSSRIRPLAADGGGDWPHTTRLLPWMLVVFIGILWLVPFEQIQLNASLPISLPLDRLALPFLIGTWLLALAAGGPAKPRLRLTWIHAAVGAFAVCALLSVVLNAPDLNHTLELTSGLKRVPLFLSYLSLFVIVASVVRPTEVNAMLKYMLVLALICAVGMIVEYRFAYNVFYDLSQKLFPSVFTVGTTNAAGVDEIGRRVIRGSAGHPLEAVAMLSIGLSIALVGLMHTKRWWPRIGYVVAVMLLLAAMISTYRKSALLAPVAVVLTIAWFRPRQLMKLAPLAVVLLAGVHVVAPGAFGSITQQLNSSRLSVPTVSDRVVRYDAVRPDVWSHLIFGRGLGTYDHVAHRILDSEVLGRLIETGVFGLVTYLLMMISVVCIAAKVIRSGGVRTRAAMIGAASAVSFAVVSFLYDTLSFPHGPYLFLCVAGFVAVIGAERAHGAPDRDGAAPDRGVAPAVALSGAPATVGVAREERDLAPALVL